MQLTQKLQEIFPEYKSYKQLELDLVKGNNQFIVERIIAVPELKSHFFYETAGVLVFDAQKLMDFIRQNEVFASSYTKYKQKITLTADGKSIAEELGHVVLNFPFKECVLEGGMSTEDKKRSEIFYNETLAPEEITRLFEPKALTNFKSYGDRNGKINHKKDNLLIKGNNLLALHSLLPKYRGKVKLIYIDPPYNTGNDGFKYNDAFNHSTWLVFMKNRLEVARQLLAEDGSIYVQLDYNEVHYCKVLMDEVFGRENFQREIIWRIGWVSGYKTAVKNWVRNHDTILFYGKTEKYNFYSEDGIFPDLPKCFDGLTRQSRPYQIEAFKRFCYYFEKGKKTKSIHLLFQMATGSGKTHIMAGLMLYLYEKGYRNFLFFVNSTAILEKTRENFLAIGSEKCLFKNGITVQEVSNFEFVREDAINICMKSIQKLHKDLATPKENMLSLEDLKNKKL